MTTIQMFLVIFVLIFVLLVVLCLGFVAFVIHKNLPKLLNSQHAVISSIPPQAIHVYVNNSTPNVPGVETKPPIPTEAQPPEKTALQKLQERKDRLKFNDPQLKKVEANFTTAGKKVVSNA